MNQDGMRFDRTNEQHRSVDKDWKFAMEKIDDLNDKLVRSYHKMKLEWCPTLTPIDRDPLCGLTLMYGKEIVSRYYGVPSRFTVLADLEKHLKQNIYYY